MSEAALIVGGGPAGAAVACLLAAANRPPLLIEREAEPRHKVCGEFLSWEAQAALGALGVDLEALGASHITRLRLIHGHDIAEAALPFTARGLTRRALDAALLARAETLGARVLRGVAVRAITADGAGLKVEADTTQQVDALFLASGKHDVRGQKRDARGTVDDLIGFKSYVRLSDAQAQALDGYIEVMLFDGGYAGLQRVENGLANLCLLVTRRRFARVAKRWPDLLAALAEETPHLAARLDGAVEQLARPLTIAGLPYGFIHRPNSADPIRLFRVGDQLGVIPSFAGDGLSIALLSGAAAARAWLRGQDARTYHDAMTPLLHWPIGLAGALYRAGASPAGRALMLRAARVWPGLMRFAAAHTRMSAAMLAKAGLEGQIDAPRA